VQVSLLNGYPSEWVNEYDHERREENVYDEHTIAYDIDEGPHNCVVPQLFEIDKTCQGIRGTGLTHLEEYYWEESWPKIFVLYQISTPDVLRQDSNADQKQHNEGEEGGY